MTALREALLRFAIVIIPSILATSSATAQNCRAANDSSHDMIEMIKSYSIATDSIAKATRDSLRLPALRSASSIALVTKQATCKSANAAYRAVAVGDRQTLSGQVFVVRAGSVYIVWDPAYRVISSQPQDVYVVFDSKWHKLSIF